MFVTGAIDIISYDIMNIKYQELIFPLITNEIA